MDDAIPAPAPGCPQCAQFVKLVVQLLAEIEQLQGQVRQLQERVRELEARLNTHSGNSSLPPSANPPSAPKFPPKPPTARKPGGQPGHPGHHRFRLPPERVNHVVPHVPERCERCQATLPEKAGPDDPEPTWHQVAELPEVLATITEHQGHARTCPYCGHVTWGAIPPEVLAHAFGPNLAATLAYLSPERQRRFRPPNARSIFGPTRW